MPSTFEVAHEIALAPFLQREELREDVRQRHYAAEARAAAGVRWSGMEPKPETPRSAAEIRADAEVACARADAFARSPRGVFLLAIRQLEQLGYQGAVDKARSACSRGFSDPAKPAIQGEVGVALLALNDIPGPDACTARAALAEILLETGRRAA